MVASARQPGIDSPACTTVTPQRSSIARECAGVGSPGPPSARSTSAGVTPYLGPSVSPQCTTTPAPQAAAATPAASDREGERPVPSYEPAHATIGRSPSER